MVTLLTLPRELRDMIYEYVLSSPTTLIALPIRKLAASGPVPLSKYVRYTAYYPNTASESHLPTDLSLRAVSRQTRFELTEVFYRKMVVVVSCTWTGIELLEIDRTYPHTFRLIQNIWLRLCLIPPGDNLGRALTVLSKWAREGNLKTMTVRAKVRSSIVDGTTTELMDKWLGSMSKGDPVFNKTLDTFHTTFAQAEWAPVRRRLEIGVEHGFSPQGYDQDSNMMMEQLHRAFGGELWTGKGAVKLCYRNGQVIRRPFLFRSEAHS